VHGIGVYDAMRMFRGLRRPPYNTRMEPSDAIPLNSSAGDTLVAALAEDLVANRETGYWWRFLIGAGGLQSLFGERET
jgi:hypothetical protein